MTYATTPLNASADKDIVRALVDDGYARVRAARMRQQLIQIGPLADWPDFAASWDDLVLDTYMADHGRYRLRRHAVYAAPCAGEIRRESHQPHYQSLDYNPLHGGIERWYEPIAPAIGAGQSLGTILHFCRDIFGALAPAARAWRIETHQFRIEARAGSPGKPTPEGMHRDGVDYVLVLLVQRRNIQSGTTMIENVDTKRSNSFTLTDPLDAALVDDARVYHGVTPVEPLDASRPAYRDVLVVTFRKT